MDEEYKRPKRKKHIFGRIMAFLALTLLCVIVTLFGVVWVALRGASPTITAAVCNSLRETSALRWVPGLFLSDAELDGYFADGAVETDEAKRLEIYQNAQRRLADLAVQYPMVTNLRLLAMTNDVGGSDEARLIPIYTFSNFDQLYFK